MVRDNIEKKGKRAKGHLRSGSFQIFPLFPLYILVLYSKPEGVKYGIFIFLVVSCDLNFVLDGGAFLPA